MSGPTSHGQDGSATEFGAGRWTGRLVAAALAAALVPGCIPGVDSGGSGDEPFPDVRPPSLAPQPEFGAVVSGANAPPPLSGGTLKVLRDGKTAVAADPDSDRIFIADLGRSTLLQKVQLQPGDEPGRVIEDAEGRVHVALRRGGAVVTLLPPTYAEPVRRRVCAAPRGLAFDSRRQLVHVACAEGKIVSLVADPAVTEPARTLEVQPDLRDIAVQGDRLFVSRFRAADLLVVNATGTMEARMAPIPRTRHKTFIQKAGKETTFESRMVSERPAVAWRLQPVGTDRFLMLHQSASTEGVSVEPGGYGGADTCSGLVSAALTRFEGGRATGPAMAIGNATLAVDMAVGPDGRVALVAPGNAHNRGVPQLMVVDPNQVNGQCEPGGGPFPGRRPVSDAGVPLDWERRDADVPTEGPLDDLGVPPGPIAAQPNGEAIAVDFARNGHIVVQTRDPATLQIMTHSGKGLVLSYERTKHTGHAVFHANSSAGLACASCHPEGGDDGLVWTFEKIGPRRTQSLRGGILQTAPFHWDGDMKTMDVLMKDVFEQRMSGPKLEARHHEALAAWMDRIPAMPAKRSPTEESVARGKMLFESPAVGCARCHGGPMLTDNTTVNVGTGKPMQVPPLRGVAWRAPFMHTGCAQTLADRFKKDCGGDDRHGVTSRLSAAQLADLVAYMESL